MQLIYDPEAQGKSLRLCPFMSGSGTNVRKIIEYQLKLENPPYKTVLIFTDNKESNAENIANEYDIPHICNDIMDFYRSKGQATKKDLSLRPEFDQRTVNLIESYAIDLIALGGYMSIITHPLLKRYPARIVNVHPADLSVKEDDKRKYTGAHAVREAILAGEKYLYASTHIVREKVDYGEILMRSEPLEVKLPENITLTDLRKPENKNLLNNIADEHQNKLKERGDWVIFPKTIEMIALGRYGVDDRRNIFVDSRLVPNGYRL